MPTTGPAPKRSRVSGIDRTIQILDYLSEVGAPTSAYDIAKSVGAPISTIYAIVDDLVARNLLSRPSPKMVWLGARLLRYGLAYEAGLNLLAEAKREMEMLSRKLGETVQICVRDEGFMVVAAMAYGDGHFRVTSDVGTRVPLNWTASGRLLVGHLSAEERQAIFGEHAKPSPTEKAETDPVTLAQLAGDDFDRQLAVQFGASDFAVSCIASPIRDGDGTCVATISIVAAEPKAREKFQIYSAEVRAAAATIERSVGRIAA